MAGLPAARARSETLKTLDDYFGIDPDFTGGVDAATYVRRLRGSETMADTLRVTFSAEALALLADLERRTGKPAGDLLVEALALLDKAVEVTQAGGRVLVERDGERFVVGI